MYSHTRAPSVMWKAVALAGGADDEGSPAREIANNQLTEVGAQLKPSARWMTRQRSIREVSIAAAVGINLVKSYTEASIDGGECDRHG